MLEIECKECGYRGSTDTTRLFPTLGTYHARRYVCPKCFSRNIEYKPRPNMEWLAWMSRTKELKELQKGEGKK